MENCPECKNSIEFVCTTCQSFLCKKCINNHKREDCYFDKPQTYFSRLLAVKRENIEEHFKSCDEMNGQLPILKKALNTCDTSMQEKIKEDIKSMEDYCKKVNKAEARLKRREADLKKEVPIAERFEKIKQLEDSFDVPELNNESKKILQRQNSYVGSSKKNDEEQGLKQAERELQISLGNQIDNWVKGIQESANKYAKDAKNSRQDVNSLKVKYRKRKKKCADKKAEIKKDTAERSKAQEELEKKKKELIEENEKLLKNNDELKNKENEYKSEIENKQRTRDEITKEIETEQNKLNGITEEIEKQSEISKKLEKDNNKQALNLKKITERLGRRKKSISKKEEELDKLNKESNEFTGKIEGQRHNLDELEKEYFEKKKTIDDLVKKEGGIKKEMLELEMMKKVLRHKCDTLDISIARLTMTEEDYTEKNKKLKEENSKLTKQKEKLESELENLEQKRHEKSEECEKKDKEIQDLDKQKSDSEEKIKNFDEEFMRRNKKELQSRKQKMKKEVAEEKKKYDELLPQYKELDGKHKLQNSELENLKNELNSIKENNKNLVAKIKTLKAEHKQKKQELTNLTENLKGKISKFDHGLYCILEEMKRDKEKYMKEVKDPLEKRINEFANHIKEVRRRIETRAKEASKVFTDLRELCKNTTSNANYINNEESSSEVKIDLNKSDINQIYINIKEIIQRMNNAYLKLEDEKEAEIVKLREDIVENNNSIKEYKETIRDKEVELIEYMNLLKEKEISLEEMKKENTKLTKAKGELSKQLEDFRNNEINLKERYNKLKEEEGKLKERITALEGKSNYLENENKRIQGESEVLNTKINRLESIKATLEENNTFKETEIKKLNEKIIELNTSIREYNTTIESNKDSIRDKEDKLMQYTNSLNEVKTSLEEMKEKNTELTEAKDELNKQLEDVKKNETNLKEEYNKLKEEKSKVDDSIKTLEKGLKDLKDENEKVKRESGDLNNKILSLEDTKTKLEEDNPSLKEDLKNYKQGNENLRKQIEEEQSKAEELKKEIDALKKRESELTNRIKNIKENAFKPTEGKFSAIEQTIIKTEESVSNLNKIFKTVIEKINEAKEKSKEEKSPNKSIVQENRKEEDKVETIEEKQGSPLNNTEGLENEFTSLKNETHNLIASELEAIKERHKKVNELLSQGKLQLIKKIRDFNTIIKTKLSETMKPEESTISNVNRLKDIIHKLKTKPEKKKDNLLSVLVIKESVVFQANKANNEFKKEQSTNGEIDTTNKNNKKERQELISNIQRIIKRFKGDFEPLKNKTKDLLVNEVKVTRKVVITQFKEMCQLIHKRELRIVKKIECSYETTKEKLSTIINVGDEVTSKVNRLKPLMIKLKPQVSKRNVAKDCPPININESEHKKEDNKPPAPEPKGKATHEDNKAKKSKGICNIQLVGPIYRDEIFISGILKDVTKENLYEKKSIKLLSEICCFCLKGKPRQKAICLYHSRCYSCSNKTKKDCILCQVFEFKPLDFACDNCKNIVSLTDINTLTCMHKKCNYCTMKTGTCNICKAARYKLVVRVL